MSKTDKIIKELKKNFFFKRVSEHSNDCIMWQDLEKKCDCYIGYRWKWVKKAFSKIKKEARKELIEEVEKFQQKYFKYITRDGVWSFKFNQYHDHTTDMIMGKDLEDILDKLKKAGE